MLVINTARASTKTSQKLAEFERVAQGSWKLAKKAESFGTCRMCGRKLKSAASKRLGMGPVCFRKYQLQSNHKKLF